MAGSFVRNAASVLATTAISVPLAFATSVILARYLSVADRGLYALLTTFALVVFVLAQLGWAEAAIYRLRRHGVGPSRVLATGLAASAGIGALALVLCLAFEGPITRSLLGQVPHDLYRAAALIAVCMLIGDCLRGVARGLDRFDLHNLFGFCQSTGLLAALVWVLVAEPGGLRAALHASLAVQVGLVTVFLVVLARVAGLASAPSLAEGVEHLRFGLALYPQGLLNHLHERVDLFVLAWLALAPAEIGVYAVAVSVINPLQLIPGAVGMALLPELAAQRAADVARFSAAVARQVLMQMTLAAALMVPVGIVAIPLLFGESYRGSIAPFLCLLPGVVGLATGRVLSRYFAVVGRQRALLAVRSAALALNVGLNLLLVPALGILGAALAALCSYLAETAGIAAVFVADSGLGLGEAFAWRRSDFDPYLARARRLFARSS